MNNMAKFPRRKLHRTQRRAAMWVYALLLMLAVAAARILLFTARNDGSGRCPQLSKKLLSNVSKKNTLMVSLSDWNQHHLLANWLASVNAAGITYFIVGAADMPTSMYLSSRRIPCFEMFNASAIGGRFSPFHR
jgi:hypothetical protein